MKKILYIALVLSVIWHGLAFFLFKIAESYRKKDVPLSPISVSFIDFSGIYKKKFNSNGSRVAFNKRYPLTTSDYLDHIFFNIDIDPAKTKLLYGLHDSSQSLPAKIIKRKPLFDLPRESVKTGYQEIIESNPIHYNALNGVEMNSDTDNDTDLISGFETKDNESSINYILLPEMESLFSPMPESVLNGINVTFYFSINGLGQIRNIIVDKKSGVEDDITKLLSCFKNWRFNIPSNTKGSDLSAIKWGRIVFFSK